MENKIIALSLKNLTFSYSDKNSEVIKNFSLDVEKGSFTTLLGPSGCGKTTLLRLISGFLEPQSGCIELNGRNQKGIEPDKRKIGMVFQDYALFPHMNIKQNIMFGLKSATRSECKEKIMQLAVRLSIEELLDRYPNELSGGQQQRVALARAMILNPEVILMDEPLSSLDTKLREKVREELKAIQKQFGVTTVYVTHDQEEALSLSDKIAVINDGKLLQYGTPRDLYFKPMDRFTADFVGRANFFEDKEVQYIVRPEWFTLNKTDKKGDVEGTVDSISFLGERTRFVISVEKGPNNDSKTLSVTADLPTLESNFLEPGRFVSLNIENRWIFKRDF